MKVPTTNLTGTLAQGCSAPHNGIWSLAKFRVALCIDRMPCELGWCRGHVAVRTALTPGKKPRLFPKLEGPQLLSF